MDGPIVSVITATYNSDAETLSAAISSALRQSYGGIELLISDDSPGDQVRQVVRRFSDPRISYRRNLQPLGVAGNHWQCIREGERDFVVILNHDDLLEPHFVERLLRPMLADASLAVAFCDHWIVDAGGRRLLDETGAAAARYGRDSLAPGMHQPFDGLLVRQTIPMAMGAMFRRDAVGDELPPEVGPAYDLWLTYLLCRSGRGAWYLPERLSSWRVHPSSQTAIGDLSLLHGAAFCWGRIAADDRLKGVRDRARVMQASALHACSKWCSRHGRPAEARRYALEAWSAGPSWRAMAAYALSWRHGASLEGR